MDRVYSTVFYAGATSATNTATAGLVSRLMMMKLALNAVLLTRRLAACPTLSPGTLRSISSWYVVYCCYYYCYY